MFENRYVHIDLLMRHLQIDYLNVMEISDFINKFLVTSQLVTRKYVRETSTRPDVFPPLDHLVDKGLLQHPSTIETWEEFNDMASFWTSPCSLSLSHIGTQSYLLIEIVRSYLYIISQSWRLCIGPNNRHWIALTLHKPQSPRRYSLSLSLCIKYPIH